MNLRIPKLPGIVALVLLGALCTGAGDAPRSSAEELDRVADLAHNAQHGRAGDKGTAQRQLFAELRDKSPVLFELMADPDSERRTDALLSAGPVKFTGFPAAAQEALVRARPYLVEMCRGAADNRRLREFAFQRLEDSGPEAGLAIGHFLLEDDAALQKLAMPCVGRWKLPACSADEVKLVTEALPVIARLAIVSERPLGPGDRDPVVEGARAILQQMGPTKEVVAALLKVAREGRNASPAVFALRGLGETNRQVQEALLALAGHEQTASEALWPIQITLVRSAGDYTARLSSTDADVRRGVVRVFAWSGTPPDEAMVKTLLALPERDEPAIRAAMARILCRLTPARFAELDRMALFGSKTEQAFVQDILTRAGEAKLPGDVTSAKNDETVSEQTWMGLHTGTGAGPRGELQQQILAQGSDTQKTHLAEYLLTGVSRDTTGPVTRAACRKLILAIHGTAHPAVYYGGEMSDPDPSLPWTSPPPQTVLTAASASLGSGAGTGMLAAITLLLLALALLCGSVYRAIQPRP
jgi:hypothetical protein